MHKVNPEVQTFSSAHLYICNLKFTFMARVWWTRGRDLKWKLPLFCGFEADRLSRDVWCRRCHLDVRLVSICGIQLRSDLSSFYLATLLYSNLFEINITFISKFFSLFLSLSLRCSLWATRSKLSTPCGLCKKFYVAISTFLCPSKSYFTQKSFGSSFWFGVIPSESQI